MSFSTTCKHSNWKINRAKFGYMCYMRLPSLQTHITRFLCWSITWRQWCQIKCACAIKIILDKILVILFAFVSNARVSFSHSPRSTPVGFANIGSACVSTRNRRIVRFRSESIDREIRMHFGGFDVSRRVCCVHNPTKCALLSIF